MIEVHLTILHSLRGRIRVKLDSPVQSPARFVSALIEKQGVRRAEYCPVTHNLLLEYGVEIPRDTLLLHAAGCYLQVHGLEKGLLHIENTQRHRSSISITGQIALVAILADIGLRCFFPLSQAARVLRWLSVGATIGAIIEHGYRELEVRGSFDPEVVSVVYLINTINNAGAWYAPAISWGLTFGRHLLQRHSHIKLRMEKCAGEKRAYYVEVFAREGLDVAGYIGDFTRKCAASFALPWDVEQSGGIAYL